MQKLLHEDLLILKATPSPSISVRNNFRNKNKLDPTVSNFSIEDTPMFENRKISSIYCHTKNELNPEGYDNRLKLNPLKKLNTFNITDKSDNTF